MSKVQALLAAARARAAAARAELVASGAIVETPADAPKQVIKPAAPVAPVAPATPTAVTAEDRARKIAAARALARAAAAPAVKVASPLPVIEEAVRQQTAAPAEIATVEQSVDLTPQQFQVLDKIEHLKVALLTQTPNMPVLLAMIHKSLSHDPELVHFLTPDQVGVITKACFAHAKIVITVAAVKKATLAGGKKLSQTTLDDI